MIEAAALSVPRNVVPRTGYVSSIALRLQALLQRIRDGKPYPDR